MTSHENLPPNVILRLFKEVKTLASTPPEGIKFLPSEEENMGEIFAEIEGPTGTPYQGHFFKLKLTLPSDFPSSPPRGFFLTKIYHPNVNPTSGDICVNTLKKDWTSDTTLSHVLSVIRCLLIVPFPESSLNDEAGKLFMDSYEEYGRRAGLMAGIHAPKRSSLGVAVVVGGADIEAKENCKPVDAGDGKKKVGKKEEVKKKNLKRL